MSAYLARKAADLKSGNVTLASGKRIRRPQPGKPDSWNLELQSRYPIPINPGTVQENFAEYVKVPFYSLRALTHANGGAPTLVHAAGEVEVIAPEKGTLRCRITAWPQTPSKVVVTRVAKPQRVLFAGAPAKFEYIPERRALVVEITASACGVLEVVP